MGAVGSRLDEGCSIILRDQERFTVTGLTIKGSRGRTLFNVTTNSSTPVKRYTVKYDNAQDRPVEYIQDPETIPTTETPSFILRVPFEEELTFDFACAVADNNLNLTRPSATSDFTRPSATSDFTQNQAQSNVPSLTFVFASSSREVESLVTSEFHADPNFHKNPNVQLVNAENSTATSTSAINWSWKWRPPKPSEDPNKGWLTACSFVEYDQRAHKLNTLASWSFWVQNVPQQQHSPQQMSPRLDTLSPPRLRVPSAQSIGSRMSMISDTDGLDFSIAPPSPVIEHMSEHGLGLVSSNNDLVEKLDVSCGRPGDDLSATEDGPVFRATMKSLEAKTSTFRSRMKKVLRTAEAAEAAHISYNDAVAAFTEALREASSSHANAVRPALENYFEKIAKEIFQYEKQNTTDLRKLVIDPIRKLYNIDIKQAESKKRDFEEESKDYYAYVGKYLGQRSESLKEKKRNESDTKYIAKRRTFELKRFDYSSYMHDLSGGRKDQEVLSLLTKYANAQAKGYMMTAKSVEDMLPQLEALCLEVTQADKEFQLQRTEREERRRALEKNPRASVADVESAAQGTPSLGLAQAGSGFDAERQRAATYSTSPPTQSGNRPINAADSTFMPMRQTSNRFKGFRDLEDRDTSTADAAYRKEGLLWSLSRPGGHIDPKTPLKSAWHKFWIVLDQGKLSEYVNWKDKLDLHMDPIDLRMASVRESRSSERRFCFEVITPTYTRVYQAPSEEDMKAWINAINNALQSAFETRDVATGYSAETSSSTSGPKKDIAAVLTGKSSSFSGHRLTSYSSSHSASQKAVARHATTGDKPTYLRPEAADSGTSEVLQKVREVDQGNRFCADCNSESKVEWVSINLGIVLCIECSGIHRSLGTHISKVRSLTLDNSAFTPDIIDVLLLVGNRISNMTWEARLDRNTKLSPNSNREQRLQFIQAKYDQRAFVAPTAQHADDLLLMSIKRNDIQGVLHALALRANPNVLDRSRATHAVFLALAAADPAMPGGNPVSATFPNTRSSTTLGLTPHTLATIPQSPATPMRISGELSRPGTPSSPDRRRFPVAEVLLQNGADLPPLPAPIPLTAAAMQYLEFKSEQRTGARTYAASPSNVNTNLNTGMSQGAGNRVSFGGGVNVGTFDASGDGYKGQPQSATTAKSSWASASGFVGGVKALGGGHDGLKR